jgi:hypothetical protein
MDHAPGAPSEAPDTMAARSASLAYSCRVAHSSVQLSSSESTALAPSMKNRMSGSKRACHG